MGGNGVKIRRKIIGVATVFASVAAGMLVTTTPAFAAIQDCTSYPGTVCMAQNRDWSGRIWRQYPDQINGCRRLTGFDNQASAMITPGHVYVELFDNTNCTGSSFESGVGGDTQLWAFFNDKASSIRVTQY
jgi:hypothetical protein